MKNKIQVYAVIRIDLEYSMPNSVTVTEILPTMEMAVSEVDRLNNLNADKGCIYLWQTTRYYPNGRST